MVGIVLIHSVTHSSLRNSGEGEIVLVNVELAPPSHKIFCLLILHFTLGHWPKWFFGVSPAVALKTSVDAVFHHGDELLVAQEAVPVVVKYLENCKKSS